MYNERVLPIKNMKSQTRKRILSEESVEAKPRNIASEPNTVSDELKNLAKGAVDSTWRDLLAGSGTAISEQILGFGASENELVEGQEISLKQQVEGGRDKIQTSIEHLEYFRTVQNADRIGETRTETQIKQAVEEIRLEIKKLIATSKLVERTVKDATAEKAPVKPGKYHVTFFEFVLSVVRDATRKLEDSVSFGAVFTNKKQQRQYWSMYKKKGTTFGLSGERVVATQTG